MPLSPISWWRVISRVFCTWRGSALWDSIGMRQQAWHQLASACVWRPCTASASSLPVRWEFTGQRSGCSRVLEAATERGAGGRNAAASPASWPRLPRGQEAFRGVSVGQLPPAPLAAAWASQIESSWFPSCLNRLRGLCGSWAWEHDTSGHPGETSRTACDQSRFAHVLVPFSHSQSLHPAAPLKVSLSAHAPTSLLDRGGRLARMRGSLGPRSCQTGIKCVQHSF
jgi:hypothetical protein